MTIPTDPDETSEENTASIMHDAANEITSDTAYLQDTFPFDDSSARLEDFLTFDSLIYPTCP